MSTLSLLQNFHFTQHLILSFEDVLQENLLIVACCTFGKPESSTLTPKLFKNKTNVNLIPLGNNRNHLQKFSKQKSSCCPLLWFFNLKLSKHFCCDSYFRSKSWMEHLLLRIITIFGFKLIGHKEGCVK